MALSMMLVRNSAMFPRLGVMSVTSRVAGLSPRLASSTTTTAQEEMSRFWETNAHKKRPMSPHLTIYRPQLTSMLSITHRGTGAAMAGSLYLAAMAMLVSPWDFTTIINAIKALELNPWFFISVKYAIAWPISYHAMNGIRHLSWDLGYGFSLKTLYRSGWFVFLTSFLLADVLVFML